MWSTFVKYVQLLFISAPLWIFHPLHYVLLITFAGDLKKSVCNASLEACHFKVIGDFAINLAPQKKAKDLNAACEWNGDGQSLSVKYSSQLRQSKVNPALYLFHLSPRARTSRRAKFRSVHAGCSTGAGQRS